MAGDERGSNLRPACPLCGGPLERVPRQWLDRLLSLFSPRRRYRCRTWRCNWEGTLRYNPSAPRADVEKRYQRRVDGG
jgi:hypothetical protein